MTHPTKQSQIGVAAGPDPTKESHIGIEYDPNSHQIIVTRDPFWVKKPLNEVAEWFCLRDHRHSENCFKVIFDQDAKKNPFQIPDCTSDANGYASSGHVKRGFPGSNKKTYKYSVVVENDTLDPQGGVRPQG